MTNWTHFGFQKVTEDEKTQKVQSLFNNVSQQYDLMNDLMSLGIHRFWKDQFVWKLPLKTNSLILDVAGGTGDIPLKICKTFPHLNPRVIVCDLTYGMIQVGRDRALNQGFTYQSIEWVCGNAEKLPMPDKSVDFYTIVFGLRNVTRISLALQEAHRVLKPGGMFACLEFSSVKLPILDRLYDLYSFTVLPWLGDVVAKDRDAYQYLAESIRRFPNQEALVGLLQDVGFRSVSWQNWLGGISCLHTAYK
jgi:ubiquinone/menaquinone biosynthesis methyltransferase